MHTCIDERLSAHSRSISPPVGSFSECMLESRLSCIPKPRLMIASTLLSALLVGFSHITVYQPCHIDGHSRSFLPLLVIGVSGGSVGVTISDCFLQLSSGSGHGIYTPKGSRWIRAWLFPAFLDSFILIKLLNTENSTTQTSFS